MLISQKAKKEIENRGEQKNFGKTGKKSFQNFSCFSKKVEERKESSE